MEIQKYIISKFEENFKKYKHKKIILYGVGLNTETIIDTFSDYNIVGLMDNSRTNQYFYGKKVFSLEEVAQINPDIIIVVAKSSSRKIIYKRISAFINKYNYLLYGIDGKNLCELLGPYNPVKGENNQYMINEEVFKTEIVCHDVIVFSIWNVLLLRQIWDDADFETILSKKMPMKSYKDEKLFLLEAITIIREKIYDLFKFSQNKNKKIILVSNNILEKNQLEKLLTSFEINEYDELRIQQQQTLQDVLNNIQKENMRGKVLYIGCEETSRCLSNKGGFDILLVKSPKQLWEISRYKEVGKYQKTINDRSLLSIFFSVAFNNPFVFYKTDGRLCIKEAYKLGALFYAPFSVYMILKFIKIIKSGGYSGIIFSARDGYLVQKLYHLVKKNLELQDLPKDFYFEISRSVCWRASIFDEKDILQVLEECQVNLYEIYLQRLFGINKDDVDTYDSDKYEDMKDYALRHKDKIYDVAKQSRENCLEYISQYSFEKTGKYAFFDFTSRGTCQYWLSKLLPCEIEGVYFCHYDHPRMRTMNLPIKAVLEENSYIPDTYFFEHYVDAEMVYSSDKPSLFGFEKDGTPVYYEEVRAKIELEYMKDMQQGIYDVFELYIKRLFIDDIEVSKDVVDQMYSFIDLKYTNECCREKDFLMREDACGVARSLLSATEYSTRGLR